MITTRLRQDDMDRPDLHATNVQRENPLQESPKVEFQYSHHDVSTLLASLARCCQEVWYSPLCCLLSLFCPDMHHLHKGSNAQIARFRLLHMKNSHPAPESSGKIDVIQSRSLAALS